MPCKPSRSSTRDVRVTASGPHNPSSPPWNIMSVSVRGLHSAAPGSLFRSADSEARQPRLTCLRFRLISGLERTPTQDRDGGLIAAQAVARAPNPRRRAARAPSRPEAGHCRRAPRHTTDPGPVDHLTSRRSSSTDPGSRPRQARLSLTPWRSSPATGGPPAAEAKTAFRAGPDLAARPGRPRDAQPRWARPSANSNERRHVDGLEPRP